MMFQGIGQLCRTHDLCQGDQTLSPDMNLWHQEYQAEPSSVEFSNFQRKCQAGSAVIHLGHCHTYQQFSLCLL